MKWSEKSLDELGFVSRGKSRHRPRDAAQLYGGPYPFIQTADVKHANLYITDFAQTYSEAGLAQSKIWPTGTLCITIAANIADTAILSFDACFPDSVIGFIADEDKADTRFVKYMFDAFLQRKYKRFTQGAAQDNLSQEKLLSLKFPVPDVSIQREVADAISAYDDLIENNQRRIGLLEQAARLLYKEWIINLRFPGHEHIKTVNGIPERWAHVPLQELCLDVRVVVDPAKVSPDTPYIGLEHIPRRSITLSEWGYSHQVESSKFRFNKGDILFGKIRPYFHKVGCALVDGITSSDAVVARAVDPQLQYYCLLLLASDEFVSLASKTVREGSKMPRADWKYLRKCKFYRPENSVLSEFNTIAESMVEQMRILANQSRKLTEARDLLLPRLMNGEIAT